MHIATMAPASPEAVAGILSQPETDDGRSAWQWVALADGTIMLAVLPQGDTFELWSQREAILRINASERTIEYEEEE